MNIYLTTASVIGDRDFEQEHIANQGGAYQG
mgnify:CR=1 FL=1